MRVVRLDQPFKPSWDFLAACVVFGGPALWLWLPTQAGLPWYSYVASCIFIPVAAAIVCYCPILVVIAMVTGGGTQRRTAAALAGALAAACLFLLVAWWMVGFSAVPHVVVSVAVVLAQMIFAVLATKRLNQSIQPNAHHPPLSKHDDRT